MAFRIHDSVVRGEIDNRRKGVVSGKIWLEGSGEPVTLTLKGNAHSDLAGCFLSFTNPRERLRHPHLKSLATQQRGVVGDMTASRKARVFDIPVEEAYLMSKQKHPPEHMANSLYLEWFSSTNGRVVIESTDYELTISPPAWRLTAEEEAQRARDAAKAMQDFLKELTETINEHERKLKDHDEPWGEHDYERFLKESDARTEKYSELLDKYGYFDEAEARIAHEMGWDRGLSEEEAAARNQWIEDVNRACGEALNEPEPEPDPHREGIDWIRTDKDYVCHPLQDRCFESAIRIRDEVKTLGLLEDPDSDLSNFLTEFQIASAKLAGALNGIARGYDSHDSAFTVASLKRTLDHVHKAQAGLEAVAAKKILPTRMLAETRKELLEIRQGILNLMDEFRC